MKAIKWLAIALVAYVGLVVAFEGLVGFMGKRQAERGVQPGEQWIVITTTDTAGATHDTVIAGVERDGQLYVSANHWPRGWYTRAVAHPDVEVARGPEKKPYRAVPLEGEDRTRIAAQYELPWFIRFLTGFPPRSFLHLDPRKTP
ncbi:MAG: nitroreductase/quinone reductase family protein [bacterium]